MDTAETSNTNIDDVVLRWENGVNWRLRSHGRLFGGLITGGAGKGKTHLVRRIAVDAVEAGLRVSLYDSIGHDGLFINGASHCSSYSQILEALQRTAEAELPLRRDHLWAKPMRTDDHLIILDHAEQFLDDHRAMQWIEQIARCGSKLGVAIVLTSQDGARVPNACRHGNLVALPWQARRDLTRSGIGTADLPEHPAYHVDPVDGAVTGFNPRP